MQLVLQLKFIVCLTALNCNIFIGFAIETMQCVELGRMAHSPVRPPRHPRPTAESALATTTLHQRAIDCSEVAGVHRNTQMENDILSKLIRELTRSPRLLPPHIPCMLRLSVPSVRLQKISDTLRLPCPRARFKKPNCGIVHACLLFWWSCCQRLPAKCVRTENNHYM